MEAAVRRLFAILATAFGLSLVTACGHGSVAASTTTGPSAATAAGGAAPRAASTFVIAGVVTNGGGGGVAGATVTARGSLNGRFTAPSTTTSASGAYLIEITAEPWTASGGRYAARLEVMADGYDWYWSNISAVDERPTANVQLHAVNRIPAGASTVVTVSSATGDCTGWLYPPCGRARVLVPTNGTLTLEATGGQDSSDGLTIEACCAEGNERQGNPVALPVPSGMEVWVEVGHRRPGYPEETVTLTTHLEGF